MEFWHLLGWSSGPTWDDREEKATKKIWSKFQEQLGGFAATLYEFSRWEKLQSSRSFSPHPVVPRAQPSPAGPSFCLVLVPPSLICRETGTLCQIFSRFYNRLSPADIQSTNYHHDQQEVN